jgi:DNA-directed RNA polymerase specialized sigma24 family protein
MGTMQADRERAAARWLIEQDDPQFSDEQRAAFAIWFSASKENRSTYLSLARSWHRTHALRRRGPRLFRRLARVLRKMNGCPAEDARRVAHGVFKVLVTPSSSCEEGWPSQPLARAAACNIARDLVHSEHTDERWIEATSLITTAFVPLCLPQLNNSSMRVFAGAGIDPRLLLVIEIKQIVGDVIDGLSEGTRQVYAMCKVFGYTEQQIAGRLRCSTDAVREHLDIAAFTCAVRVLQKVPPERQPLLFGALRNRDSHSREREHA